LTHGELERRSRCCKKRAFRSLNREGALCWSDSFFELKQFQYTLLATLADKRANPGELFGFDRAAAISDQSAEIIASSAQSFGQRMTSPLSAFYQRCLNFRIARAV
jgi:hypothetical protein